LSRLEPTDILNTAIQCSRCNGILQPGEKFCGYCGQEVAVHDEAASSDAFEVIKPTLIYYFVTLILLIVYKFTHVLPHDIDGFFGVSVIDILIVIVFWGYFFHDLSPLFSLRRLQVKVILLTITGACVGALCVSKLADLINVSLFDEVYNRTYLFEDTSHPLLWATIMICLQPAIFEEVAFRGFMFSNLQVLASSRGAVFISAILFGIMHLSFISIMWLIPLGIVFAMLRVKYDTLWYGIIGHFVYNFTIVALEFFMQ
jgi:membrane protease YdiL (CAAX protease family)